ncbi:MAG: LPS export ABC transporter periplasmic protein LptC [Selenomonadaceae bacterium]|nr:LPS export ABC transporter periplasmic protein LptC [Selenomonadaceae bacterium]
MKLLKILLLVLMLLIFPAKTFADMPDISAGETYFDVIKGYYVLKDNVHVAINNHGHKATITANEAKVNVLTQKCWAEGKVNLTHDNETFSCDSAYLQWKTKTAEVVGNVKFNSKKIISITSETAIFNWGEKIVDFYGNVKVKAEKNLKLEDGLKVGKKIYSHVRYNVIENKILQLEEIADAPNIEIPNPDNDSE